MPNQRILVVEDEFLVADHIAMTLEDLGYVVVGPVATIAEAIAAVRTEVLDGALLDANLDGMSSASIAEELNVRAVPFVVLTGYGDLRLDSSVLDEAPRVGKPYNSQMLATMLANVFAGGEGTKA